MPVIVSKSSKSNVKTEDSYVKYKENEKKKIENFHNGNILTIFLIFWPFSSYFYKKKCVFDRIQSTPETVFEAMLGRPYTLLYVRRSVGRLLDTTTSKSILK